MKKRYFGILSLLLAFNVISSNAQPLNQKIKFTEQDTLRGSVGAERNWWDVTHYQISVTPDYNNKFIAGQNTISFKVTQGGSGKKMQVDLQEPMNIDSVIYKGKKLTVTRNGNAFSIDFSKVNFIAKSIEKLTVYYSGYPRIAKRAPWDGGWMFVKDEQGRPWMTVACQGLGASVWYPCKDYQGDEPNEGATVKITVPDSLVGVANGRLIKEQVETKGTKSYTWKVVSPINNYNIVPYIGKYVHWSDTLQGEKKTPLTLDYWVLDYDQEKAKVQFGRDVKKMLRAFEYWFGPYPFYEDGYKLVESPHLGMEHQSAVAYGNKFRNGYNGGDLSGSGWGKDWDYIIVHESGHEWFANNITSNDIADMWIHEGFTMYSESLFIDYYHGPQAASEYVQGVRFKIRNDKPIIGYYGVNQEGSGDMYNKGAGLLQNIRSIINNDSVFRSILRGLNKDFYHKTVDTKDVENYISNKSGIDFSKIFDQYLRTTKIPNLEYTIAGNVIKYRFSNCNDNFSMPIYFGKDRKLTIHPTTSWQEATLPQNLSVSDIDKNAYIKLVDADANKTKN
jgi:aminopeptidase N